MFKILIIDPNKPFRQSLKKVLVNRFPFVDIQEAPDGLEGMDMVPDFNPNLIFIDLHLPSESGFDLARKIKSVYPKIVTVILASYDSPEYKAAAVKSGVEHLVPKDDWTGEDMIALVQTIIADHNLNDPGHQEQLQPQRQPS